MSDPIAWVISADEEGTSASRIAHALVGQVTSRAVTDAMHLQLDNKYYAVQIEIIALPLRIARALLRHGSRPGAVILVIDLEEESCARKSTLLPKPRPSTALDPDPDLDLDLDLDRDRETTVSSMSTSWRARLEEPLDVRRPHLVNLHHDTCGDVRVCAVCVTGGVGRESVRERGRPASGYSTSSSTSSDAWIWCQMCGVPTKKNASTTPVDNPRRVHASDPSVPPRRSFVDSCGWCSTLQARRTEGLDWGMEVVLVGPGDEEVEQTLADEGEGLARVRAALEACVWKGATLKSETDAPHPNPQRDDGKTDVTLGSLGPNPDPNPNSYSSTAVRLDVDGVGRTGEYRATEGGVEVDVGEEIGWSGRSSANASLLNTEELDEMLARGGGMGLVGGGNGLEDLMVDMAAHRERLVQREFHTDEDRRAAANLLAERLMELMGDEMDGDEISADHHKETHDKEAGKE